MSLPPISCVCVTAGRTKRLSEAVACFLAQTYERKELLILNTCLEQHLIVDCPKVVVVNPKERPASLGDARNCAVSFTKGDIIVTFDDDDLCKPNLLSLYAEAFTEDVDWVRINPTFYSENFKVLGTFSTWINSVSVRRTAFDRIGGYDFTLSVGEDRNLFNRLSEKCTGKTIELPLDQAPWIYGFGNGCFHISGQGNDRPGVTPAWERAKLDLAKRLASGDEPTGQVRIVPKLTHDPSAMIAAWLESLMKPATTKPPICLILLGRFGDIINALPIAYHIAQTYGRPHFMVSREFASILDGVSYVIPEVVDLRNDQINEAIMLAKRKYSHVICAQIWGKNFSPQRFTEAYNVESWHQAGFGYMFNDLDRYPVFDRRDYAKEKALADKLLGHCTKPVLLVNVTHSHSSPFNRGAELLQAIKDAYANTYDVVDIGGLRLDHIYELLTAIERAAWIISIDTSLIHLTAATNTPLLALVNPAPWQGSVPRVSRFKRETYDHGIDWIENELPLPVVYHGSLPQTPLIHAPPLPAPHRTVWHVLERHTETDEKQRWRKNIAEKSWQVLYDTKGVIPRHYREYKRSAKDTLHDPRDLPYLKDCLEFGMAEAKPEDIIMWSNDDNYLHPDVVDMVQVHCSLWDIVCSQRCEFIDRAIPAGPVTPQQLASMGRMHMGRDIFAFTKSWLVKHWDEIPDLILGASDWDLLMACMVRLQWGIKSTRANLEQVMWPAEMERGYVAHQYHPPRWRESGHVDSDPSQVHNRAIFKAWAREHLPELKFYPNNVI